MKHHVIHFRGAMRLARRVRIHTRPSAWQRLQRHTRSVTVTWRMRVSRALRSLLLNRRSPL